MATLDKINQMKQQGYNESDIIISLQEQGVAARDINESLAQSNIQQASAQDPYTQMQQPSHQPQTQPGQEMQSIMTQEQQEYSEQGVPTTQSPKNFTPQTQEIGEQVPMPSQNQVPTPSQDQPPQPGQEYQDEEYEDKEYQDQGNQDYGNYEPHAEPSQTQYNYSQQYAGDTDTITEITDQLVSEKTNKINQDINIIAESNVLLTTKVEKIDERLKQIEKIIDQLQMSLLRNSTNQSQVIGDIRTEMRTMQTGFSKIINPLTDEIRKHQKPKRKARKKTTKRKTKKKKK